MQVINISLRPPKKPDKQVIFYLLEDYIILRNERIKKMKNFFILFSILTVGFLAFWDAKTRIDELESVAATTPSQVEMQRKVPNSEGKGVLNKVDSQRNFNPPINQNDNPKVQNIPQQNKDKFKPFRPNQSP